MAKGSVLTRHTRVDCRGVNTDSFSFTLTARYPLCSETCDTRLLLCHLWCSLDSFDDCSTHVISIFTNFDHGTIERIELGKCSDSNCARRDQDGLTVIDRDTCSSDRGDFGAAGKVDGTRIIVDGRGAELCSLVTGWLFEDTYSD